MPPDEFYADALTDRSLEVVTELLAKVPEAILIGGWATWRRTGALKSHDIDVLVDQAAKDQILGVCDESSQSGHVGGRKWRGTLHGIHVDLYVPYQSVLGQRLQLRTEHLLGHTEMVDGWRLIDRPAHVTTKLAALLDRLDALPGEKDRREVLSLIQDGARAADVCKVLVEASDRPAADLDALVAEGVGYLKETVKARQDRTFLDGWLAKAHEVLGDDTSGPPPPGALTFPRRVGGRRGPKPPGG